MGATWRAGRIASIVNIITTIVLVCRQSKFILLVLVFITARGHD